MRKIDGIGHLARDGKLAQAGGKDVINFTVALNGSRKDDPPEWASCALWGPRAVKLAEYLKKGTKVFIRGEFKIGTYEKDGKQVPELKVMVDELELLGDKRDKEDSVELPRF